MHYCTLVRHFIWCNPLLSSPFSSSPTESLLIKPNLSFPFHSLSQLDDVDAGRCRDGRSQYLGHISFFMIAVPMILILLNQALGSAVIDAAIPAMYSAIFVLGAYLYTISLLALLLTFCLVIAAVFYWTLVYRPAIKAHSLRKEKLKRMRSASHSPSANRQMKGSASPCRVASSSSRSESASVYLRRVFNIMRHSLQHGITLLSFRRTRCAKEMAIQRVWRAMNRVAPVHSPTSTTRAGSLMSSRRQSLLDSNLTSALASVKKVKSFDRASAKNTSWSDANSESVVIAMVSADESKRRLTPKIIFEAKDIFSTFGLTCAALKSCRTKSFCKAQRCLSLV